MGPYLQDNMPPEHVRDIARARAEAIVANYSYVKNVPLRMDEIEEIADSMLSGMSLVDIELLATGSEEKATSVVVLAEQMIDIYWIAKWLRRQHAVNGWPERTFMQACHEAHGCRFGNLLAFAPNLSSPANRKKSCGCCMKPLRRRRIRPFSSSHSRPPRPKSCLISLCDIKGFANEAVNGIKRGGRHGKPHARAAEVPV